MSGTQTNITIPGTHSGLPSSNTGTGESLEVAKDTSSQGVVHHIENVDQSQFSSTAEEPTEAPPQIAGQASIPPVKIDGTQKVLHTPPSDKIEEINKTSVPDPVVVSSNEGVDEASRIRQIRKTMDEAAAHGLAHFKIVMNEFVDSKKLYKTSDIITYQEQARDAILQAFTATFSPGTLENLDPTILHSYKKKLTESLDCPELTFTFLARYDHSTNTILKDLTKCTLEAERVYDDEMEGFEPSQKSENEIKERHNLAREKAMAKFTGLMKPLNVNATVCSKEIEWKLQENLQDLSEEFIVLEPRTEQTNVEHELHPGQNHIPEIYQEKSGSVWDLLNPVVQAYAYFFGGKSQAPGDLIEVVTSPKTDMPNSSFGNLVVQQSIHDRRDIEIGWLQFLWSKLFGRNY